DDGSRDSTPEIITRYDDPKITFLPNAVNRGFSAAINSVIARARGEYVAVLNSDDYWPQDKLEFQVAFLDDHAQFGALFGDAIFVDEHDVPLPVDQWPNRIDEANRSPGKWLRRFFEYGNCIWHPTVLIRRSCFEEIGLYDNRFRQLPDFEIW